MENRNKNNYSNSSDIELKYSPISDGNTCIGSFHVNSTRGPQVAPSDFAETLYICFNK